MRLKIETCKTVVSIAFISIMMNIPVFFIISNERLGITTLELWEWNILIPTLVIAIMFANAFISYIVSLYVLNEIHKQFLKR